MCMTHDLSTVAHSERAQRRRYIWKTWIMNGALPCGLIFAIVQTLRGEGARELLSGEFLVYATGVVGIMSFCSYWMGWAFWKFRIGTADGWRKRE
jgi:hypothetical protein